MQDLLFWIIFGLIAGSVANFIDPHPEQGGWVGSMILGIVGAVVGGYLGNMVFGIGVTGFNVSSLLVAVAGSLLVLFMSRLLRKA